jgi:hypothetical protein
MPEVEASSELRGDESNSGSRRELGSRSHERRHVPPFRGATHSITTEGIIAGRLCRRGCGRGTPKRRVKTDAGPTSSLREVFFRSTSIRIYGCTMTGEARIDDVGLASGELLSLNENFDSIHNKRWESCMRMSASLSVTQGRDVTPFTCVS